MQGFHLCHLNIGPAVAPLHDEKMTGFVENLFHVNQTAYDSPGFVWHLIIDINNPEDLAMYGEPGLLFNLSVWESMEALKGFTYEGLHASMLKRKREWFGTMDTPSYVLWWKPIGELPTLDEAKEKLAYLTANGPTEHAFTFRHAFVPTPELQLI